MRVRFSKSGLIACILYILFSAPLLLWGYSSGDVKTMLVASQLALAPAVLPVSILHLDKFVGERIWLNNIYYVYTMTHLSLYGLGMLLDPPHGIRLTGVKLAALLGTAAFLTLASIWLTADAANRLAAARARKVESGLYYGTLPNSFEVQKANSDLVLRSYPRDPRWRYAHAALAYDEDRLDVAERDLREVLGDPQAQAAFPQLVPYVRALLARIESDRGHHEIAKAMVCSSSKERELIIGLGICP